MITTSKQMRSAVIRSPRSQFFFLIGVLISPIFWLAQRNNFHYSFLLREFPTLYLSDPDVHARLLTTAQLGTSLCHISLAKLCLKHTPFLGKTIRIGDDISAAERLSASIPRDASTGSRHFCFGPLLSLWILGAAAQECLLHNRAGVTGWTKAAFSHDAGIYVPHKSKRSRSLFWWLNFIINWPSLSLCFLNSLTILPQMSLGSGDSSVLKVKVKVIFPAVEQAHFLLNLCAVVVTAG